MQPARAAPIVDHRALAALMAHSWPGNVRELRNVADRFVLGLLGEDFSRMLGHRDPIKSLPEQMEHIERALIMEELRQHHGEVSAVARALGMPKQTLYDKLRRLHIATTEFRSDD